MVGLNNRSNVYILLSIVIFHNSRFVDHGIYVPSRTSHSFYHWGNVVRSTHENSPDIRYTIHMHVKTALHPNNSPHPINATTEQ